MVFCSKCLYVISYYSNEIKKLIPRTCGAIFISCSIQSGYSHLPTGKFSAYATCSTSLPLRGILKQASPYPRLKKRRTSLMRFYSFSKILYEFSSRKKLPSNLCLCYNGTHDYFDIEGTERVEITAII